MKKPIETKQYLGDGVYVDTDGYQLILTTEDGIQTLQVIYLEPSVIQKLVDYYEWLKGVHQ